MSSKIVRELKTRDLTSEEKYRFVKMYYKVMISKGSDGKLYTKRPSNNCNGCAFRNMRDCHVRKVNLFGNGEFSKCYYVIYKDITDGV